MWLTWIVAVGFAVFGLILWGLAGTVASLVDRVEILETELEEKADKTGEQVYDDDTEGWRAK